MSETQSQSAPGRNFWIISSVALVWNLIGVATYLGTVSMTPEALAALPEAERALQTDVPAWVTSAYAIAVFGGTLGSLALLLRKAWAFPVLVVSLVAILLQMGHAFLATDMIAVQGVSATILPLFVIIVGMYLVVFANSARSKGWLT